MIFFCFERVFVNLMISLGIYLSVGVTVSDDTNIVSECVCVSCTYVRDVPYLLSLAV